MFRTLLIANRGEIACRVARTASRLGIETVAVFSDADAHALHVKAADRAYPIGPASARDSYLNIPRIIATAEAAGADAIHPGYGFLSENPAFAEACAAAGIVFVGPPPSAMRAMGSKSSAKALMEQSDVPLLHGLPRRSSGQRLSGRPGGADRLPCRHQSGFRRWRRRGMRVVTSAGDFNAALASAQQEAASAFGDDRVLIERYLQRPRHIRGSGLRRHPRQHPPSFRTRLLGSSVAIRKIIEEAPAPDLPEAQREGRWDPPRWPPRALSVTSARAPVEFVAESGKFSFLEMNTRLQVEHPVTEMITGFDLVEWQLRVAAGEALPVTQSAIRRSGHAIEARVYAEDPARDFAPSVGRLALFRTPTETPETRIDTGFATGDTTVSIHYDAMLAKLICHGPTRDAALRRMRQALADSAVVGVASNLDLLGRVVAHPEFAAGGIDTGFIAREARSLLIDAGAPPPRDTGSRRAGGAGSGGRGGETAGRCQRRSQQLRPGTSAICGG